MLQLPPTAHAIKFSLNPREPSGLWRTALKTHKDQTIYWCEWFTFIWHRLQSSGSEGVLVVSPGLCYKSYCMSGASQNPPVIIPPCWKSPERNEGEEREGEFELPLVKSDRSSFHLLAEAVLRNSPLGMTELQVWATRLVRTEQPGRASVP